MPHDLPFIDPTRGGSRTKLQRAPRAMDLTGKVVALLDNTKEQADIILHALGEDLRKRYGVSEVILTRKEFFSKPAKPELIDELSKKAHVAVAAVGG
jgi:hypothetical protein